MPEKNRRERSTLIKLHQINRAIHTEHNMEKLLNLIMDNALDLTRAERGFVIMMRRDGTFVVRVARNLSKNVIDHPQFKVSRGIIDEVFKSGQPVILEDAGKDKHFSGRESVTNLKLASIACLPLKSQSRVMGVLYLDNRYRKGLFEAGDLLMLETFADAASTALMNAALMQQIEEKNKDLELANLQLKESNQELEKDVEHKSTVIKDLEKKLKLKPPEW